MMPNHLLWLSSPMLLASLLFGQSPLFTYGNEGGLRYLAQDVAFLGDVDADGRADVYVGSPGGLGYQIRSGRTGRLIRQVTMSVTMSACGLGDVDGDGYGDYLMTDAQRSSEGARLFSGKTGKVVWKMPKTNGITRGFDCAAIADLDGDKILDALVTTRGDRNGIMHVLSGKTGKAIRAHGSNPVLYENYAWAIAVLGDIDADGFSDYMVAAPLIRTVTVYSGKTGKFLRLHTGKKINGFGQVLCGLGDLDGDKIADYLIAGSTTHIYSGKTGLLLQDLKIAILDCANPGDIDGDHVSDILIGRGGNYKVQALSGKTRKVLWEDSPNPPVSGTGGGAHVDAGPDVNADGTPDFVYNLRQTRTSPIRAHLMSGKSLDFHADINELSASLGGKARFTLEGGRSMAARLYLVLGTVSGTSPGIPLGNNLTLPLQVDAWFWATLTGPNRAPLTNSLGFLDLTGKAEAAFSLPINRYVFLQGLTFHHAYVVFGKNYQSIVHASQAVPVRIYR